MKNNLQDIGIVQKLAWNFKNTSGFPFDELYSEALLAYSEALNTFKEKDTKFSTWVYVNTKNALINFIKKEKNTNWVDIEAYRDYSNSSVWDNPYWELRQLFSEDAKEVTDEIVNNPMLYVGKAPKMIRGQIVKELREKGWYWGRIWDCIREIKKIIN